MLDNVSYVNLKLCVGSDALLFASPQRRAVLRCAPLDPASTGAAA